MHLGLPSMASMGPLAFGSSESGCGTSVNSAMLVWASEISPSASWMSSYVSSTSDIVSICNAMIGN